MPSPAVGLVHPDVGQHAVCGSPLFGVREIHDGRAYEGVVEREPVRCIVQICEAYLLCRSNVAKAGVRRRSRFQYAHVPGAIERHQQQLPRPRRKLNDPRSEECLKPPAQRQCRWQRVSPRPRRTAQGSWQLQKRKRIAHSLDQDPLANGWPQPGEARIQKPACR